MAVAPTLPVKVAEADEAGSRSASFRRRLAGVGVRGRDLILVACLLMVVGFVHAWNMSGYPGFITDDEGTYTAQAWAVLNRGALAHYAYTYDHPPLGWILIAGYAWLTDAFDRVTPSVLVGREAMLLVNLVSCALLYVLARRLRLHRVAAGGAVLLFGLSPLAVHFHRMVFLDNLSVMWALAAFVLAAAPRRGRIAAGGCAACFAAAVLSKETALLLLPAVIWLLVQNTDRPVRRRRLILFFGCFAALVASYPVYAIVKGELLGQLHTPPDRYSLLRGVWWQLTERPGTVNWVVDPSSWTYIVANQWFELDPWFLITGAALAPVALAVRPLRPVALALIIHVAMMFRGGYIPYPYVIVVLPFEALVIAGVAGRLWEVTGGRHRDGWRRYLLVDRFSRRNTRRVGAAALAMVMVMLGTAAGPTWAAGLHREMTEDRSAPYRQALAWIDRSVSRDSVVLVDDYIWVDLARKGFTKQVWLFKTDWEPFVHREFFADGSDRVDYIVLAGWIAGQLDAYPTARGAIERSDVIKSFGDGVITIRKVVR